MKHANKCSSGEERSATGEEKLGAADNRPDARYERDPSVGPYFLRDHLRKNHSQQERDLEDRDTSVVVVGVHAQIVKEPWTKATLSLADVRY